MPNARGSRDESTPAGRTACRSITRSRPRGIVAHGCLASPLMADRRPDRGPELSGLSPRPAAAAAMPREKCRCSSAGVGRTVRSTSSPWRCSKTRSPARGCSRSCTPIPDPRCAQPCSTVLKDLLADLNITQTHNRPRVSNDNQFSESEFRTMKYRPNCPGTNSDIEQAREFMGWCVP